MGDYEVDLWLSLPMIEFEQAKKEPTDPCTQEEFERFVKICEYYKRQRTLVIFKVKRPTVTFKHRQQRVKEKKGINHG